MEVKCVHRDIHQYPVVSLVLKFKGKKHRVKTAVSPRLLYPLILGPDWPGFHSLLGQYAGVRSRPVDACNVCAAFNGDTGSSDTDSGGEEAAGSFTEDPPPLVACGRFPTRAVSGRHPTLSL